MKLLGALACLLSGKHAYPERAEIGGFRCPRCGMPGADYDAFDSQLPGYVDPERKLFDRESRLRKGA